MYGAVLNHKVYTKYEQLLLLLQEAALTTPR